jgi:hypothetical protein
LSGWDIVIVSMVSAFRTVVLTREDEFRLLSGTLKTYIKTRESRARHPADVLPRMWLTDLLHPQSTAPFWPQMGQFKSMLP